MTKERRSLWYSLWQWLLCRCLELFYRRLEVSGKHHIPKNKPVIFASNHTNALMDPLVISYFSGRQHYFMTRGDVFKIKIIGALFRSWRMLPIFRMKDGKETLSNNDPVMEFVTQKVAGGESMIIFPEGSHFWKRQVHPLRKGLVRMAFSILEKDPESELVIIPVGLYYNELTRLNQDVLVNFGSPILVKNFPREDTPQKTFYRFNEFMREAMKDQIIHIDLEGEAYEQAEQWRQELAERLITLPVIDSYHYQQQFLKEVSHPNFQRNIPDWPLTLDDALYRHELRDWWKELKEKIPPPTWSAKLAVWIKYPFYWLAFIHFLPVFVLNRKIIKGVKDITFHSSIKFGLALLVQPIFALIQGAVLAFIIGSLWVLPLYLLTMPIWATLFTEWRGRRGYTF